MSDPIRQLAREMRALARDAGATATRAINRALPRLEAALEQEAPVDSGALVASIHSVPATVKRNPRGRVQADSHHAAAVDLGTEDTRANDFVDRAVDREGPRMIDQAAADFARGI